MLKSLKSLSLEQLTQLVKELGEPDYRGEQIFRFLMNGIKSYDEMGNVPKALRNKLAEEWTAAAPVIVAKQSSAEDGTIKYLFELEDKNRIESVLMKYKYGNSVCLSSQAGCKMGCAFCASFDPGSTRNLTAGEMLDEVLMVQKDSGEKVSHLVLMGTGEPLDNLDEVLKFISLITHPLGQNLSMRHISLSTCGLVPGILKLAEMKLQLTLSVSLHAPSDEIRNRIMPVNRAFPLKQLMDACKLYFQQTGRRISFEYAMISGVNDSVLCASQLAQLVRGFPSHVNLIPLNPVPGGVFLPSERETIKQFQNELLQRGVNVTVRRSLGRDIDASCGQLRRRMAQQKEVGLYESLGCEPRRQDTPDK